MASLARMLQSHAHPKAVSAQHFGSRSISKVQHLQHCPWLHHIQRQLSLTQSLQGCHALRRLPGPAIHLLASHWTVPVLAEHCWAGVKIKLPGGLLCAGFCMVICSETAVAHPTLTPGRPMLDCWMIDCCPAGTIKVGVKGAINDTE